MADHQIDPNSRMAQHGAYLADKEQFNHSMKRKRGFDYHKMSTQPQQARQIPVQQVKGHFLSSENDENIWTGFFATTLSDAVKYAGKFVFIPALRGLADSVLTSIKDQLLYEGGKAEYPVITPKLTGQKSKSTSDLKVAGQLSDHDKRYKPILIRAEDCGNSVEKAREKAFSILSELYNYMEHDSNHEATVSKLYRIAKVRSEWTDDQFGWHSMSGAAVKKHPDGWIILMPEPEVILCDY